MNPAARFLSALAQAISAMILYREGHPARDRAGEKAMEALTRLQSESENGEFMFLVPDVVYNRRPLADLKGWDWAERLVAVGIQRIELTGPVSRTELEQFLDDIAGLMLGVEEPRPEPLRTGEGRIHYGSLRVRNEEDEPETPPSTDFLDFPLREEIETIRWIHHELRERGVLHLLEAESLVRSLALVMHSREGMVLPLMRLDSPEAYMGTHGLNVAVLAMALSEFTGVDRTGIRLFGLGGLLHDLGNVRVPGETLSHPGPFSEADWEAVKRHPAQGARIILETDHHLDLPGVVAYEHHIRPGGEGYPRMAHPRPAHAAARLIQVCDAYDAMSSVRPWRGSWDHQRALDYISLGAGTEFDAGFAGAFVRMMARWDSGIVTLTSEGAEVKLG